MPESLASLLLELNSSANAIIWAIDRNITCKEIKAYKRIECEKIKLKILSERKKIEMNEDRKIGRNG